VRSGRGRVNEVSDRSNAAKRMDGKRVARHTAGREGGGRGAREVRREEVACVANAEKSRAFFF
jgi:hypothetical protein